jgi:hypothetical protein
VPAAAARRRNLTEEELIDWGSETWAGFLILLLFLHIAYLFESQYYYVTVTVQFFFLWVAMCKPAHQFERMTGETIPADYVGIVFVFCVCFYNYLFHYLNSITITAAAAVITAATAVAAVLMRWWRWRR